MASSSEQRDSILERIAALTVDRPEVVNVMSADARRELGGMLATGKDLKLADLQEMLGRIAGGDGDEDSVSDH